VRPYVALTFAPLIEPVHEYSFPSGHVAVLSALAFTAWRRRPAAGAALFAGAIIVGVARVLAGVHWPIDILGGMAVGAISALLTHLLVEYFSKKK
jgi:undecaprenyl-diphosphatase